MWFIRHVENSRKLCSWKFIFNNKEMIYLSLWWWSYYMDTMSIKRQLNWGFWGCVVCCQRNQSGPVEATSFHCSPKIRMQMIPRGSIKLQHKRIDDCETEAMMKPGFIFSSPQRPVTPKLVSILPCLLGLSYKSRKKMLTVFTAMKCRFNSKTHMHLVDIICIYFKS